MKRVITALLALPLLAGCGNLRAIHFNDGLRANRALMVDSNQRGVITGDFSDSRAVCAEPAPDTTSVMALAASANLSRSEAEQLQAALSMSESTMNIGLRTPTIQLLRDGMYRLCEAYMNGAIDRSRYTVLINRYQQMMIGLVAIEQLTGVVRTSQNRISAGQASASGSMAPPRINGSAELRYLEQRRDSAQRRLEQFDPPPVIPAPADESASERERRARYDRANAEYTMYANAVAQQITTNQETQKAPANNQPNEVETEAGQNANGTDRDPSTSHTTIPSHVSQAVERITQSITRANLTEFACLPTYDWLYPNDRPIKGGEGATSRRYALRECLGMASADTRARLQAELIAAYSDVSSSYAEEEAVVAAAIDAAERATREVTDAANQSQQRTQGLTQPKLRERDGSKPN